MNEVVELSVCLTNTNIDHYFARIFSFNPGDFQPGKLSNKTAMVVHWTSTGLCHEASQGPDVGTKLGNIDEWIGRRPLHRGAVYLPNDDLEPRFVEPANPTDQLACGVFGQHMERSKVGLGGPANSGAKRAQRHITFGQDQT